MAFDSEEFRGELLDLIETRRTCFLCMEYRTEGHWNDLYDGIDMLLQSGDTECIDTAGLFITTFADQIVQSPSGPAKMAEWLVFLESSHHWNAQSDVAIVREILIPPAP